MPCEIMIQLRESLVILEASCGAEFAADVLRRDGYDAQVPIPDVVLIKEKLNQEKEKA